MSHHDYPISDDIINKMTPPMSSESEGKASPSCSRCGTRISQGALCSLCWAELNSHAACTDCRPAPPAPEARSKQEHVFDAGKMIPATCTRDHVADTNKMILPCKLPLASSGVQAKPEQGQGERRYSVTTHPSGGFWVADGSGPDARAVAVSDSRYDADMIARVLNTELADLRRRLGWYEKRDDDLVKPYQKHTTKEECEGCGCLMLTPGEVIAMLERQLAAATRRTEAAEMALKPVAAAVRDKNSSVMDPSWNPDYHLEITITVTEARLVVAALAPGAADGKVP